MKIEYLDDIIVLFINNLDIDFKNPDNIKKYFKEIFLKLKNNLKIELNGFYLVKVYKNINELVIEIKLEELDFYDLYNDEIDMKIVIEENDFLYEIEDIFIDKNIIKDCYIIKYKNKLYLKIKKEINKIKLSYLKEISNLKYKDNYNIINYGEYLNIK